MKASISHEMSASVKLTAVAGVNIFGTGASAEVSGTVSGGFSGGVDMSRTFSWEIHQLYIREQRWLLTKVEAPFIVIDSENATRQEIHDAVRRYVKKNSDPVGWREVPIGKSGANLRWTLDRNPSNLERWIAVEDVKAEDGECPAVVATIFTNWLGAGPTDHRMSAIGEFIVTKPGGGFDSKLHAGVFRSGIRAEVEVGDQAFKAARSWLGLH